MRSAQFSARNPHERTGRWAIGPTSLTTRISKNEAGGARRHMPVAGAQGIIVLHFCTLVSRVAQLSMVRGAAAYYGWRLEEGSNGGETPLGFKIAYWAMCSQVRRGAAPWALLGNAGGVSGFRSGDVGGAVLGGAGDRGTRCGASVGMAE